MDLLAGKDAANRVAGMLNAKYQVHRYCIHLTVKSVYSLDPVGQLDFGGNEYVPAGKIEIASHHRRPEDRYEWWDLGRDCYFVEFNETLELAENEIALLEPDERLLRAGASHVTMFLRGHVAPIETLLHVEALRLQLKTNARVSLLRLFRLEGPAAPAKALTARAVRSPKKTPKKKPARR